MNKIVSFDYIRVISVIGIILCHCCFGIDGLDFLGRFLGNTFNVIFLSLSAFLLGIQWKKRSYKAYNKDFLHKRIGKLTHTYYPFILIMFLFLAYTGYNVSVKNVILHFSFLPWLNKLTGFGHLWFITMIVICYIGIYTISKLPLAFVKKCKQGGVAILLLTIIPQLVMGKLGLPVSLFTYLFFYLYIFLNAENFLKFLTEKPLKPMFALGGLCIMSIIIALYLLGYTNEYARTWLGIISACITFTFLFKLFLNAKSNKFIDFIAAISFEIYLVHHVFCFGKYSLFRVVENPVLGTLSIFALSLILAIILNKIGKITELLFCSQKHIKRLK